MNLFGGSIVSGCKISLFGKTLRRLVLLVSLVAVTVGGASNAFAFSDGTAEAAVAATQRAKDAAPAAPSLANAQVVPPMAVHPKTTPSDTDTDDTPDSTTENETYTIHVLAQNAKGAPLPNTVVFLRAARVRGPFEPTAPPPQHEWTGITDAQGRAQFEVSSDDVDGLRLQAFMTVDGRAFESTAERPESGLLLRLHTYEVTHSLEHFKIKNLRIVPQVWEGYVTFTALYALTNDGDKAIDLSKLPGQDFEKGLPLRLPVKAKGISATGGQTQIVQSTVYLTTFLKPGEVAHLELQYSMSQTGKKFVYEQVVDYPVENVEVIVPLETRYRKLPRLNDVGLIAPGFAQVGATDENSSPLGLRPDVDFIAAWGLHLKKGGTILFKLTGLPFKEPDVPWALVAGAFLFGVVLLLLGLRFARGRETSSVEDQRTVLEQERDDIANQINVLDAAFAAEDIDEAQYKLRRRLLSQRLCLVVAKLEAIGESETVVL